MPEPEENHNSVSKWIRSLKSGSDDAAKELWDRYHKILTKIARQKLGPHPRCVSDEEDVAVSVFAAFFRGAQNGRFRQLNDRVDLWKLLVVITQNKVRDQKRRARALKRNGGRTGQMLDDYMVPMPSEEDLSDLEEEFEYLMGQLTDEKMKQIATLFLEGRTKHEIAEMLDVCIRTVERKRELIRDIWLDSLDK